MADSEQQATESATDMTAPEIDNVWKSRAPFVVWLLMSVGFLAYLAFGSVEARIWSYGRLFFQDRKIVHVWAYFGDRLPDLPGSPLTPMLYYVSIAVMVLGTILGLWYMLMSDDGSTASSVTSNHSRHHA